MRQLQPRLKEWFDSRLLNPEPLAFHEGNPVKMLILTAQACLGIAERGKDNCGEMVELFQSTIGRAEQEPWCMAFLQSCVAYIESFGFTSDLFPSEHCLTVWVNSKCRRPVEPVPGDMVIYRLGDTTKGHAELITAVFPLSLATIGGNTGAPNDEIERNGDGVYSKIRVRGGTFKMREVGFLRLF